MVKTSGDRLISLAIFMTVPALICIALLPLIEVPASASWIYLFLSIVIHTAYYHSLINAYKYGDLSHVYPIARGIAPVLVLIGGIIFVNEIPLINQWLGVLIVSIGIMSLAFERGNPLREYDNRALWYALLTGFWIAAYTLVDGIGARLAGNPLNFILWLFVLECWPILFYAFYRRGWKVLEFFKQNTKICLFGGIASAAAYGIVIYALSLGFMAGVSALRETSVVIATLIGILLFKEDNAWRRVSAAVFVAVGVVLMNW